MYILCNTNPCQTKPWVLFMKRVAQILPKQLLNNSFNLGQHMDVWACVGMVKMTDEETIGLLFGGWPWNTIPGRKLGIQGKYKCAGLQGKVERERRSLKGKISTWIKIFTYIRTMPDLKVSPYMVHYWAIIDSSSYRWLWVQPRPPF